MHVNILLCVYVLPIEFNCQLVILVNSAGSLSIYLHFLFYVNFPIFVETE